MGIKGKWYKDREKITKKPLPNLFLALFHIYSLISEASFVAQPTTAHRNKDLTANLTPLSTE